MSMIIKRFERNWEKVAKAFICDTKNEPDKRLAKPQVAFYKFINKGALLKIHWKKEGGGDKAKIDKRWEFWGT